MQDENIARDLYVSEGRHGIKGSYFAETGIVRASVENELVTFGGRRWLRSKRAASDSRPNSVY